jgi:hypothetical protein
MRQSNLGGCTETNLGGCTETEKPPKRFSVQWLSNVRLVGEGAKPPKFDPATRRRLIKIAMP